MDVVTVSPESSFYPGKVQSDLLSSCYRGKNEQLHPASGQARHISRFIHIYTRDKIPQWI